MKINPESPYITRKSSRFYLGVIIFSLITFIILALGPKITALGDKLHSVNAGPMELVNQDFNGTTADVLTAGWYAENELTPGVIDANIIPAPSPKNSSAYHTPGGDRAFGFYKTSDKNSKQDSFIRFTYTATVPLSDISGSFDFESTYGFWDSSKPRQIGFSIDSLGTNGFTYSHNGDPQVEILSGTEIGIISNTLVTKDYDKIWLSDAEMDLLGLSIRSIPFSLTGLTMNPCDTLVLYWNSTEPVNLYEDMQVNLDNFILEGIALDPELKDLIQVDDDWSTLADCTTVNVAGTDYTLGIDAFATIQAGLNHVNANGTVMVNPGTYTENLSLDKSTTLVGVDLPTLAASGSTALACTGASDIVLKGFSVDNAGTLFGVGDCNLTAYANNFNNYVTPLNLTSGTANLGHNWWGSYTPSGLSGSDEEYRLGAPVADWVEGTAGDVILGNASLDSLANQGLAVIVNHGRGQDAAPFGLQGKSDGQRICSDYFDMFIVGVGTGDYQVNIIVDDTPDCRTLYNSPLLKDGLYSYNRSSMDWEIVPNAGHDTESVFAVLNASFLDGTPFVADSGEMDLFLPVIQK